MGPALDSLEKAGVLKHPALKQAFDRLYGYTSTEQGIRHALLDKDAADVGLNEAIFMFGACASFAALSHREAPAGRRRMTPLENRLVLHRFLCSEFGYSDLSAMLDRLRDVPIGFTAGGESEYAKAFYLNPERAGISPDRFADYDAENRSAEPAACA